MSVQRADNSFSRRDALKFAAAAGAGMALPFAASLARRYGSTVHLVHVLELPLSVAMPSDASVLNYQQLYEQAKERARENMKELAASTRLAGLPHESVVQDGTIAETLREIVREREIDMIVLGTHGRGGLSKLMLGSVAEEIFRTATVPVLTVGPGVKGEAPEEIQVKRVLYATDFSESAGRALPYALSLAQEHQARLAILHVADQNLPPVELKRPAELLWQLVPEDVSLWCEPEVVVQVGSVADRILETAQEQETDLIVMGVRGAGFYGRASTHFVGGTASQVVRRATCPVLTVRG